MSDSDPAWSAGLLDEERRLAAAGAAGDGAAFAELYERYERRAYNLALRVSGSAEDAADAVQDAFLGVMRRLRDGAPEDFAFGSYLFTSTRNACYDLMRARARTDPSDAIPDSATPLGSGSGGLGLDPGDPEEDPDRRQLLAAQRDEIRAANGRLPERQREVLALRELEELSYDEIAAIMEMNRNSVAQLISRARINLRAELRGEALASVAAAGECERALPLIASREDRQRLGAADAEWLDRHLEECPSCPLRIEQMHEAGVSYRAWAPVAAAPALFEETMAKAAELAGTDWSAEIAARAADRADPARLPGMPSPYRPGPPPRTRRSALAAAALIGALLVVLALAGSLGESDRTSGLPDAKPADAIVDVVEPSAQERRARPERSAPRPAPVEEVVEPAPPVTASGAGGPERSVQPSGTRPSPAVRQPPPPRSPRPRQVEPPARPAPQATPETVAPPAEPPPASQPQPETEPEREPEPPRPPVPGGPGDITTPPGPPPVP